MSEAIEQLHEQTRTPRPIDPNYDWRKEPWVNDDNVRALSYYIAFHILTAMQAEGDDAQEEEDERVFLLLSPELTESVWKGPNSDEIIRARQAAAAAMGIDKLISQWISKLGSIDSEGPKQKANS